MRAWGKKLAALLGVSCCSLGVSSSSFGGLLVRKLLEL